MTTSSATQSVRRRSVNRATISAKPLATSLNPYASIPRTANPFPAPQPPPASYFYDRNSRCSFTHLRPEHLPCASHLLWNLAVEQQLGKTALGAGSPMSARTSSHQFNPSDINPIYNSTVARTSATACLLLGNQRCRTTPTRSRPRDTGGNANYHSLQASLQKRVRHGLTGISQLHLVQGDRQHRLRRVGATAVVPGNSYVLPIYEPNYKRLDHGPSDFDHRNVISISYVWALPKFKEANAAAALRPQRMADQRHLSSPAAAIRSQSPEPMSSGTGLNRDRAIWNGQNPYGGNACADHGTPAEVYLNTSELLDQPELHRQLPLSYGNIVKGSFVGPRLPNLGCERHALLPDPRGDCSSSSARSSSTF